MAWLWVPKPRVPKWDVHTRNSWWIDVHPPNSPEPASGMLMLRLHLGEPPGPAAMNWSNIGDGDPTATFVGDSTKDPQTCLLVPGAFHFHLHSSSFKPLQAEHGHSPTPRVQNSITTRITTRQTDHCPPAHDLQSKSSWNSIQYQQLHQRRAMANPIVPVYHGISWVPSGNQTWQSKIPHLKMIFPC